ncbi:MAG TPA: hypothetical protein VKU60_12275 [Chloroflexota bacterium]|nr:hypothetical protein [Chloroflexota bacterium]
MASATFDHALPRLRSCAADRVSFGGWLYRVAQDILLGQRRAFRSAGPYVCSVKPADPQQAWLLEALQRLTVQQRSVAIMRAVQAIPLADAAYALRMSESQVMVLQRQALQALEPLRPK